MIPDDYLPDVHNRLIMYKRISSATSDDQLRSLEIEMIDRFGLLPPPSKTLFRVARLRVAADALGLTKIDASAGGGALEFGSQTRVDPMAIVTLVQQQPKQFRLEGGTRLRFIHDLSEHERRISFIEELLARLALSQPTKPR